MTRTLLLLTLIFSFSAVGAKDRSGFDFGVMESIAIQDRGRLKPFQTFAEESVLYVTGRRSWKGMSATEVVLGWLVNYEEEWQNAPFILVDYKPLKEKVGLDPGRKYFSPKELEDADQFQSFIGDVLQKQRQKESLSPLEKKARDVQGRRGLVEAVVIGEAISILPNPNGLNEDWFSLSELADPGRLPYTGDQGASVGAKLRRMIDAFQKAEANEWNKEVAEFALYLKNPLSNGNYPAASVLDREMHYNALRPFRVSWILYLVGVILSIAAIVTRKKALEWAGFGGIVLGLAMHSYGFVIRALVSGRPPVTNMYESVIWVTWGCVLFALLVWLKYRNLVVIASSAVFAVVGLVMADNIPNILDPGIHPLEPVLRSNYWLTIHVLTITLSYAAFAVSLCVGNVVLGYYLFAPKNTAKAQEYSLYMYRAVQIGVVLLAAGTILGGVWADESWGRFWGWDPKEVWALVALLLYLAVLHGRFAGWLRGFGFAAANVISFLGVLMAWYGVNFVLGVGLHSYGFGTGGLPYVSAYAVLQLAFIAVAYVQYRKALADGPLDRSIFPKGGGVR